MQSTSHLNNSQKPVQILQSAGTIVERDGFTLAFSLRQKQQQISTNSWSDGNRTLGNLDQRKPVFYAVDKMPVQFLSGGRQASDYHFPDHVIPNQKELRDQADDKHAAGLTSLGWAATQTRRSDGRFLLAAKRLWVTSRKMPLQGLTDETEVYPTKIFNLYELDCSKPSTKSDLDTIPKEVQNVKIFDPETGNIVKACAAGSIECVDKVLFHDMGDHALVRAHSNTSDSRRCDTLIHSHGFKMQSNIKPGGDINVSFHAPLDMFAQISPSPARMAQIPTAETYRIKKDGSAHKTGNGEELFDGVPDITLSKFDTNPAYTQSKKDFYSSLIFNNKILSAWATHDSNINVVLAKRNSRTTLSRVFKKHKKSGMHLKCRQFIYDSCRADSNGLPYDVALNFRNTH